MSASCPGLESPNQPNHPNSKRVSDSDSSDDADDQDFQVPETDGNSTGSDDLFTNLPSVPRPRPKAPTPAAPEDVGRPILGRVSQVCWNACFLKHCPLAHGF